MSLATKDLTLLPPFLDHPHPDHGFMRLSAERKLWINNKIDISFIASPDHKIFTNPSLFY